MRLRFYGLSSLAVFTVSGCAGVTEPSGVAEPALLRSYDETRPIVVPDSVTRGVPFEVRVPTFAGGCTRSIARTDVTISGAVIEIRPLNRTVSVPGGGCTRDLLILEHRATMTVRTSGALLVRILGTERTSNSDGVPVATVIERRVAVR